MLRRKLGLGLVVAAVALAGCAQPERSTSNPGASPSTTQSQAGKKRLTAAIRGEPATLSAIIDASGVGGTAGLDEIEELIHVGMAEIVDYRVIVRPRLAQTIPTIENGLWKAFPDGRMEVTWTLNTAARWHDGTPLTSEDLVFTAQVAQDKSLTVLGNNAFTFVERVEAIDPQTVVVGWNRPFILADTMFSNGFALPIPKHILEPVYLQEKEGFAEHPYWTEQFVGAGPFKMREFVRGSHTTLEAYDHYVLGRPKIDEIDVRFINDPSVIVANVLSGTIDLSIGRGLAPEQAAEADRQWTEGKADSAYGTSWTALFPQFVDPAPAVLANVQFRRALMHALNRQQLVDTIAMGKTKVATSYVGPSAPEFREVQASVVDYPYDQRRAIELISELGFSRGADGLFVDAAGRPLAPVEIRTTAGDELRANSMLAIADMWKTVGVATEALIIPRQRASDREYRVTRPAFELTHQPNELTERALQRLQSKEIPTAQNSWRGNNRVRYASPQLDALIDKYIVTISTSERLEGAKDITRHISENLPVMGLLYRVDIMLIADRLVNVRAETDVRNAQEWDVK